MFHEASTLNSIRGDVLVRRILDKKRDWSRWAWCAGISATALTAMTTNAAAQGLFDFNTHHYVSQKQYDIWMTASRLSLMIGTTVLGFAMGWFFSPSAAHVRRVILLWMVALALMLVVRDQGLFGWSLAGAFALIGFCWGIGYWLGEVVKTLAQTPTTFGSAQWASVEHLTDQKLLGQDGIRLGTVWDGEGEVPFSYKGDRHLFTYAPTRAGKGVSHIVPNLLSHKGSVLVIDVKGENCLITAKARAEMGQQVMAIDPWDIAATQAGVTPARFNPLDWVQLSDPDAPENAMLLADALVQRHDKGEPFWQEEAKALIQGLILLVAFDANYADKRHLGTVRDLLLLTGDDQMALFEYMADSPHALVASTGARSLQKEPKLMANVMASAQAETHMLDSQRLRDALSASDFDFADLKRTALSVYLILPADRLDAFSRFLRLLVQQALTVSARNIADKPKTPVLFILDEMPALGRLAMVEQAYGLMAGFGLQIWGIAQDLCQMRRVYGEDHETFIANSGAVAYFGSPDKTSADYFSGLCGETTVWNFSTAVATAFTRSSGSGGGSTTQGDTSTDTRAAAQRKLIYPDELRRMKDELQVVLIENADPILGRKAPWFEDPELAAKGVNLHSVKAS